jgi:hypothetical protein
MSGSPAGPALTGPAPSTGPVPGGPVLGGIEAIAAVAAGALSVSDVVEGCLGRVAELDAAIGAFRLVDEQGARCRARELDDRVAGPLQGLVAGVKDVIDTAGLPTGYGSGLFADHQPAEDADVVTALRRAGAIVLGKTESTEFAMFAPARTRNPVDPARTPGGSSSGSAAAVAAGLVPVAPRRLLRCIRFQAGLGLDLHQRHLAPLRAPGHRRPVRALRVRPAAHLPGPPVTRRPGGVPVRARRSAPALEAVGRRPQRAGVGRLRR